MIHAYLIMVHARPAQLARLLRAIAHPRNIVLIHVDRKASAGERDEIARLVAGLDNVHALPSRDVRWASWSVVDATLAGIAALLSIDRRWSHFSNLSGQDFPLQPQDAVIERLQARPEANYVEYFDPSQWLAGMERIRHVRIEPPWPRRGITLPKVRRDRWQRLLGDTTYWGGSSYFTVTREFCEHLLASPRLPAFKRFFRYCYSADEIFWPSFMLDSPMRDTVVNDNLRLIDFSEGLPRPRTWTMADRDRLLRSDKLYARKFDPDVDDEIIDLLERASAAAIPAPRGR